MIRLPRCEDPSRRTHHPQSLKPTKVRSSRGIGETRIGTCACCRHKRTSLFASRVSATVADACAPWRRDVLTQAKGGGPEGWGLEGWKPKISRFFSLSRHNVHSSLPLLGWCLKRRDPDMCTFGLSGCRVKPRRLRGRRGFTRQPENSKLVCFQNAQTTDTSPRKNLKASKKLPILAQDLHCFSVVGQVFRGF